MSNPNIDHFKALEYIWKYLLMFPDLGLIYNCNGDSFIIKGYIDSDYANDINERRSTTGYIFSFSNNIANNIANNNIISWNSQLQKTVALSSCEAEYVALKEGIREAIYLNNLYKYFNNKLNLNYIIKTPVLFVDNQSAIKLAENPKFHKRTKHIDIIYHYSRQAINDNLVSIVYIPTKEQLADFLTKNLPNPQHKYLLKKANISNNIDNPGYIYKDIENKEN